jgi:hypothetical protein
MLSGTTKLRRKAFKRALPWNLVARELNLVSPPQDEDIPVTKKPRLDPIKKSTTAVTNNVNSLCFDSDGEKPTPKPKIDSLSIGAIVDTCTISTLLGKKPSPITTAIVEAATEIASPGIAMALPPLADVNDVSTDYVMNTGGTGRWTLEEDAELTIAVTNTCKKRRGKEYKTDWVTIATLVPRRTRRQCLERWQNALKPSIVIARAAGRTGTWTESEDGKLTDAVQLHGGKDWSVITALVPGRTRNQCKCRWYSALDPSIDRATGRSDMWTTDEDDKVKYSVQMYGGKGWAAIAAMVPGRTRDQYNKRWHIALDPSSARTTRTTGTWTED